MLWGILLSGCSDDATCPDPNSDDVYTTTQNTIIDVRAPDGTPICDATIICSDGPVTRVLLPGGGAQVPCRFQVEVEGETTITVHRDPYREKTVNLARRSCPGDKAVVEIRLEAP